MVNFSLSSYYRAVFWIWNKIAVDNTLMAWLFAKSCLSYVKDFFFPPFSHAPPRRRNANERGRERGRDRRPELTKVRLSTGPRQNNGIFYEIRTYDIKPAKMKEFLEMVNKYVHFRTAHSELVGFWYSELGAMNKVFHIWKYDNFAHRTAVRHALANDKDWQGKFISAALPLVEKQHNEVAYLVPWCQLGKPSKEGGVYEWVTFQMKPGGPALWGEAFRAAINAHINTGYTKLIGVFHTEYGLLNTVHVLWWNESPDHRAAGRHSAHEDARVVAAVRDSVRFLESQSNVLLIPLQCSPLK